MSDKEHLGVPRTINLSWRQSRRLLGNFIFQLYDEALYNDRDFFRKLDAVTSRSSLFVSDWGHPGRGYEDFPKSIPTKAAIASVAANPVANAAVMKMNCKAEIRSVSGRSEVFSDIG